MAAQLFPFLNKTVELVLGVTSGAGRWSVASPLRFRGTVRRSESPIFRLFDDLPGRYAIEKPPMPHLSHLSYVYNPKAELVSLEWDIVPLSLHLEQASQEIKMAVESGLASGADIDEEGGSFLFVSSEVALRSTVILTLSRKCSGSQICCSIIGGSSPPISSVLWM